jgi:ATP-dependent Zn protease
MPQMVNRHDMRCTAFHEAGHAIAAVLNGIAFEKVYIVLRVDETVGFDGMQLGQVVRTLHKPDFVADLSQAKLQVIQMLAGPLGETLAYSNLEPKLEQQSADIQDVISLLKFTLCPFILTAGEATFNPQDVAHHWPEIIKVINECVALARHLVTQHRDCISRVANELLSRGELTRAEVVAICGPDLNG